MPPRARKVIYILGLGHSGSTVLDMLLTTTGKAVGLGQVWTVLREDPSTSRDRVCSCGVSAAECEFWGPIIEHIGSLGDTASPSDRYQLVLERVERLYGPEIAVVDSSKQVTNLSVLVNDIPGLQLSVVHNIKDVRSFTISILDNQVRKGRRRVLPEKIFFQWYRGNRLSFRKSNQLLRQPPTRVMYDGLCLATEAVIERLAKSLGDQYIDPVVALDSGRTHIISGNRLRLRESVKAKKLTYDSRWLVRSEWLRPYVLMPIVRKYNEQCLREWAA